MLGGLIVEMLPPSTEQWLRDSLYGPRSGETPGRGGAEVAIRHAVKPSVLDGEAAINQVMETDERVLVELRHPYIRD